MPDFSRRRLLSGLALSALAGCATPLSNLADAVTPDAQALLAAAARAHGAAALPDVQDISVSYDGAFHALVQKLQPALVDAGFRGRSEERLLPAEALGAQSFTGAAGHKQVVRRIGDGRGDVKVWFNDVAAQDQERLAAAALVADGYRLFLLGPLALSGSPHLRAMAVAGSETLRVDGHEAVCDVLRVRLAPGIGFAASDDLALFLDRDTRLMRRVRFTVNGLDSTQGAVAEVDAWEHTALHGIMWPTRFQERLLRPFPLAVHDWRLTGLDLNRGITAAEIDGPALLGRAAVPAMAVPISSGDAG